jgi:hypothetical protein
MGDPLPEGPSPIFSLPPAIFSLPPAIFCGAVTVGRFFKELLPAVWNTGRLLGILKKDKQGENA